MTFAHLSEVLAEVEELSLRFQAAGYRLFLVGGIVRDQWLDRPLDASSDIDLTTDAHPGDIKRIVSSWADDMWTQGERFGTIGIRSSGRDYEITTHRAESYDDDSRKPKVTFGDDIEVDLSRRDFTVNAMAIELPGGELIDPWGGAADLAARILRTPLSADVSFSDDPLRMLRAARFAAKYELTPDASLASSASELHERLRIVAIERIGVELERLLGLDDPRVGLDFLVATGLLGEVVCFGDPALLETVQAKLAEAVEVASRIRPNWHMRLGAIAMVLGVDDDAAADWTRAFLRRLKLSGDDQKAVVDLVQAANTVVSLNALAPIPDSVLRKWAHVTRRAEDSIDLARAVDSDPNRVARFASGIDELWRSEDLHAVELLDGAAIMAALDIAPGPAIGQAQKFLQETYYVHGPLSLAEQAALLKSWWASRS